MRGKLEQRRADAGLFTWDLSIDTVYADAALAELFGFEAAVAESGQPAMTYLERICLTDRARVARSISDAILTGEAFQEDYQIIRPDHTVASVSGFGRCFRDINGSPLHYSGIVFPASRLLPADKSIEWHCLQARELASRIGNSAISALMDEAIHVYRGVLLNIRN